MVKRKSPEEHRKGDKGDKEDNFDKELDSLFTSSAGPSTVKSRKVDHKAQVKKVKDAVSSLNKSKPSTGRGDGGGGSNSNSDGDSDGDNKKDNDGHHSDNNINNQEDIDDETLAEFAKEMGRDDDDLKADDNEWEDDNDDNDDIHDKKKDTKKKQAPRVYKIEDETPEQKNNRTIFVGNVPAEAAKNKSLSKRLVQHLMQVSELPPTAKHDSTRFRSVAFSVPTSASAKSEADNNRYQTPKQKRKVAFIKHDLHPDAASVNAYVVFGFRRPNDVTLLNNKDKDVPPSQVAQKVVERGNGTTFEGRVLRVDRVLNLDKKGTSWHIDKDMAKRTLYVGRLDFAQKETELGEFIEKLLKEEKGEYVGVDKDDKAKSWVRGVRIVRDPDTQLGKGFGYVHLADNDCVQELLLLPDERRRLNKRTLRFAKSKASGKQKPQEDLKRDDKKETKESKKASGISAKAGKIVRGDPALGEKLSEMTKETRKTIKAADGVRQARRTAKKQQALSKKQGDQKMTLNKPRRKVSEKKPGKKNKRTPSDKALSKLILQDERRMESASAKSVTQVEHVAGTPESPHESASNPWSPWNAYSAPMQTPSSYLDNLVPDDYFADEYEQFWIDLTANGDLSIAHLQQLLFRTELPARSTEKILGLTVRGRVVQKSEFQFALALAAYAQQGQELLIDVVTMSKPPIPFPHLANESPQLHEDGWAVSAQEMSDTVSVRLEGEKEGFFFTHHNYTIDKSDNGSVSRRFSDFVWLHDCLMTRYPFRLVPNLPPKRLTLGGHSLSTDANFLETRRRGLQRFMNFTINHPILQKDGLVLTFLETPSLESWRKSTKVSLEEESQVLSRVKAMSIPTDLDERIDKLRVRLPALIEHWAELCGQLERIIKRNETDARDYVTLSNTLGTVIDSDSQAWGRGESEQLQRTRGGLEEYAAVAYDRTLDMSLQALEAARYVRDLYMAYLALLARYDRLTPHSVDKLKRNMERSQRKVHTLAMALDSVNDLKQRRSFEDEIHSQNTIIDSAQSQIQHALTKRQFARFCIWSELIQLQATETPLINNVVSTLTETHVLRFSDSTAAWRALKEKLSVCGSV
ncbi:hypothetical protein E3P98_01595 [Wallemia ichthyophaga]|nr:hypothetical protein E3P98_01595 [Wallemia ichthyophaga]